MGNHGHQHHGSVKWLRGLKSEEGDCGPGGQGQNGHLRGFGAWLESFTDANKEGPSWPTLRLWAPAPRGIPPFHLSAFFNTGSKAQEQTGTQQEHACHVSETHGGRKEGRNRRPLTAAHEARPCQLYLFLTCPGPAARLISFLTHSPPVTTPLPHHKGSLSATP